MHVYKCHHYIIMKKRIPNIYRVFCMESRINVEHTETFKRHSYRSKCKVHFKSKSLQSAVKTFENAVSFCRHILFYFFHLFFSFIFFFSSFNFSKWLPDNEVISRTSHSPVRKGRVNDNNESQKWTYTGAFLCESSYHTRGHVSEE